MAGDEQTKAYRILLVEDNPADVYLLREAFREANLESDITLLEDGAEALSLVRGFRDGAPAPVPDIVILDLNLPKQDGRAVLEAIRETGPLKSVPVVVLTTSRSPRDREIIEETDRTAVYITKPTELEEFMALGVTLRGLLENTHP